MLRVLQALPVLHRRISLFAFFDEHMREVLSATLVALALKALSAGLNFGFNVLLARLLGAEGVGVYYLALTVTSVATLIGTMGLDNALLRYTAVNAEKQDWAKLAGVCRKSLLTAAALSTASAIVIISVAPWIAENVFQKNELVTPLQLMAFSIIPMTLLGLYSEMLRGLKKVIESLLVQGIGVPLIGAALLAVLAGRLGAQGAVIAYSLATLLVLLCANWFWRRATPELRGLDGTFDTQLLIKTSLPFFWVAFMNVLMASVDTITLGIWMDSQSVGIYSAAARTSALTSFFLASVNTILAPRFAALYERGDLSTLAAVARRAAAITVLCSAPLLLLFLINPTWVMELFGSSFTAGANALSILSLGQFVNALTGSVGYMLLMCGHEKSLRNTLIGAALLNVMLNVTLIPHYGIIGAAVAGATSNVWMNISCAVLVYRKLSIGMIPISKWSLFDGT